MTQVISSKPQTHKEQVDRLKAEVDALRLQLRSAQRLAAVGTMTAMVAHEFNNLLTPIISYAQMAQKNPALSAKAIARAADGGQRASHICKAIMGMAGGSGVPNEQITVAALVEETLTVMARDLGKDGIELVRQIPDDLSVQTRKVELQQVLLNLLLNARSAVLAKNSPRCMEIRARKVDAGVCIDVADNGDGIAPENLEKIFQPFFSTRKATDARGSGHGLGLATCKEILTALGGRIAVQSTPGEGSVFTITIP